MSRSVKRVPLDFSWPLHKTWEGYRNPYYLPCPTCRDSCGWTDDRLRLNDIVFLLLLGASDINREPNTHPYFRAPGFHHQELHLTEAYGKLTEGLAGRSAFGRLGHDGGDRFETERKIITAAGLDPQTWGICPTCKGKGVDPKFVDQYEAWQETDPPVGEGWQFWMDDAPVSKVFVSPEDLAKWATMHTTVFAGAKASFDQWLTMIKEDLFYVKAGNNIFMG